jgi:hypothetical protein
MVQVNDEQQTVPILEVSAFLLPNDFLIKQWISTISISLFFIGFLYIPAYLNIMMSVWYIAIIFLASTWVLDHFMGGMRKIRSIRLELSGKSLCFTELDKRPLISIKPADLSLNQTPTNSDSKVCFDLSSVQSIKLVISIIGSRFRPLSWYQIKLQDKTIWSIRLRTTDLSIIKKFETVMGQNPYTKTNFSLLFRIGSIIWLFAQVILFGYAVLYLAAFAFSYDKCFSEKISFSSCFLR